MKRSGYGYTSILVIAVIMSLSILSESEVMIPTVVLVLPNIGWSGDGRSVNWTIWPISLCTIAAVLEPKYNVKVIDAPPPPIFEDKPPGIYVPLIACIFAYDVPLPPSAIKILKSELRPLSAVIRNPILVFAFRL